MPEKTFYKLYNHLCQDCGSQLLKLPENKKRKQKTLSTWYKKRCDRCQKIKAVTEARDFDYPVEIKDLEKITVTL